jgi:phosphoribosylformimino-5-aminoimidazole carboxamide ribotide isomerase
VKIFPAIDIHRGQVVQLVGGDPEKVAVKAELSPKQQAIQWREQAARRVHVVDLDAALGGNDQWIELGHIIQQGMPVQFGGGIRSMVQVQKLLDLGVDRVIVGTQGVQNPAWVRELALLFPGKIVLAVDARHREVVVNGWTEETGKDVIELAASLQGAGLAGFLYTNVAKEGRMEGIDAEVVRDLRDTIHDGELIVSGGITTMEDLAVLDGLGVDAVVLGMSIYTNALSLKETVHRFEQLEPEP